MSLFVVQSLMPQPPLPVESQRHRQTLYTSNVGNGLQANNQMGNTSLERMTLILSSLQLLGETLVMLNESYRRSNNTKSSPSTELSFCCLAGPE